MSGVTEWFRKLGHRLCKTHVPDKFLLPQLAGTLETADARLFKKLVQRGRLAPFYPGMDEPTSDANVVECPICCMYYRVMNKTKCCGQRICSECIVQIRIGCPLSGSSCPFCKKSCLDVEISEGKTESEKREEMLDEQRFAEFRLRQLTASNDRDEDRQSPISSENSTQSETGVLSPVATDPEQLENGNESREQNFQPITPRTDPGDASSSHYNLPTPRSVEDEYRQEYAALSRRASLSPLSNSELRQCEDYLGVCPEDLGLRLEEFNDLLLEQTLISSMIEMRKSESHESSQMLETPPPPPLLPPPTTSNRGTSSNANAGEESVDGPSLRSHSLPLPHPIPHEEPNSPVAESSEAPRWSFETVLRQVTTSPPFNLLSFPSDEPSSSAYTPAPPSPFSPSTGTAEMTHPEGSGGSESSSSEDNRAPPSELWKNLLNSLAGFEDTNPEFRMITVRFDDPEIDALFNGRSQPPTQEEAAEMTRLSTMTQESLPSVIEETFTQRKGTRAIAVENPDGTVALTSIPCEDSPSPPIDPVQQQDCAVTEATQIADRNQMDAIEAADARLRALFRRPA